MRSHAPPVLILLSLFIAFMAVFQTAAADVDMGALDRAAMTAPAGGVAKAAPAIAPIVIAQPAPAPLSELDLMLIRAAGVLLVAGIGYLAKLNAARTKNETARAILGRLADASVVAVQSVEQKMEAAPPEQKKQAALDELKAYMGPKGIAAVAMVVGGDALAKTIDGHVESAVLDMKAAS